MPKAHALLAAKIYIILQMLLAFCGARATCQMSAAKIMTRFSFRQLYGGGVLIRGKLGNYPDSLSFILDTGGGGVSLDSSTASDLKIAITPSERFVRGIAGSIKAGFVYAQELKLPGLAIDSLDFHVTDYGILTSLYGEKINGIIGYSILKDYIVELDYDSSIISFYSKGPFKYPSGGYLLKPYINFQPFQHASLRDTRKIESNFIFDIGANICLMLSSDFDNDSMPIKTNRKRFVQEAEGVGGKIVILTTVIREFKLGPYKFMDVPVGVFDDASNITEYPYGAGIIGNDLLRRFNIILNYGNQEIFLKPNSHFSDPFDYAYTGIELYYVNGVNLVGDIASGSPAEKAGLKEGDIVLGVNNTVSQSLSDLKDALMKSTGNIKIVVMRKNMLMKFHFKIMSILQKTKSY